MILIVVATLCLFLKVSVQGQTVKKNTFQEVIPLLIGDKVPDLFFDQALNVQHGNLKFSDYKGKALILDFWGTWCGACISAFPHVIEIQRNFSDHMQVLLVADSGRDDFSTVENFLQKRKENREEILLPVVVTKQTKKLFEHYHYPHYVWIGADRRVKAITDSESLEEGSIRRLIAGLDINIPVKQP